MNKLNGILHQADPVPPYFRWDFTPDLLTLYISSLAAFSPHRPPAPLSPFLSFVSSSFFFFTKIQPEFVCRFRAIEWSPSRGSWDSMHLLFSDLSPPHTVIHRSWWNGENKKISRFFSLSLHTEFRDWQTPAPLRQLFLRPRWSRGFIIENGFSSGELSLVRHSRPLLVISQRSFRIRWGRDEALSAAIKSWLELGSELLGSKISTEPY